MKRLSILLLLFALLTLTVEAQLPLNAQVQIVKAEDARRYDAGLEQLMRSPNADVRRRAALAAGRIGDERAVSVLTAILEKDASEPVRAMAAFALGETESLAAADAIVKALDTRVPAAVRARAVEAAGKISAANAKSERAKALSAAIVNSLEREFEKGAPSTILSVSVLPRCCGRVRGCGRDVPALPFLHGPGHRRGCAEHAGTAAGEECEP